jgi:hypothetical protein
MDIDARYKRMKAKSQKVFVLVGCVAAVLILISVAADLLFGRRINPVALTRYAIEQCEQIAPEAALQVGRGSASGDINHIFAALITNTSAFRGGYIRLSRNEKTEILDAWGRPLQMTLRTNLTGASNPSQSLLAKTNAILIWSLGPNGINEYGAGDDIYTR